MSLGAKLALTGRALLPPLALVFAVIGSILAGIAAVTEAAAVGVLGAITLNLIYREFAWANLWSAAMTTVRLTSMILMIVVGGTMFTAIFRVHGGPGLVGDLVTGLEFGPMGLVLFFLAIVFLLGALLDWVSVVLICIPVFLPFLAPNGIDPLWFAVLVIVMIQTSYLTPPMAPSIFYLRGIAPKEFTYGDMYRGVLPFVACQLLVLIAVLLAPEIATGLPAYFFNP